MIGRATNRQDAIEILCEGVVDAYEREQGRSRYDIDNLVKKTRKDGYHYYREAGGEVTSWFVIREESEGEPYEP